LLPLQVQAEIIRKMKILSVILANKQVQL